jgi:hypothetical protein
MGLTACNTETDAWVGLVVLGFMTNQDQLKLVSHLVLHDRPLGVKGDDIILQAYTGYLMGQDKPDLIP